MTTGKHKDIGPDYLNNFDQVSAFFGTPPWKVSPEGELAGIWGGAAGKELAEYNRSLGADAAALENIQLLTQGDCGAVVTGQQPCLFGGPLYVLYKAACAIVMARKMSKRLGKPMVPVFWNASDDDDFAEISSARVLDGKSSVSSISYAPNIDMQNVSCFYLPAGADIEKCIDIFRTTVPESEHKRWVVELLADAGRGSSSFSEWVSRILSGLLSSYGMALFEPRLESGRRFAAPIIKKEIENPGVSSRLVNEAGAELDRQGYGAQLSKSPDAVNFFLYRDGRRGRVKFRDGRFKVVWSDRKEDFSRDEMLQKLSEGPQAFSPNALLRCVVQSRLFPGACTVLGPSEMLYWAQLKQVFAHFETVMPSIMPRSRAVIVDGKIQRLMEKYGLTNEDCLSRDKKVVAAMSKAEEISDEIAVSRKKAAEILEGLVPSLENLDPTLATRAAKIRQKIDYELAKLSSSAGRAVIRRNETEARRLARIVNNFRPLNCDQERILSFCSALAAYGPYLVEEIVERIEVGTTRIQFLEI
ncbi:bacillithiol biosynthesis cysteine-adding enzyme BshC [Candidatus Hydrogenedentota bacterium]